MNTNTTIVTSGAWSPGVEVVNRTFCQRGRLKRLRYRVQHSDWNAMIIRRERLLNRLCIGAIAAALLYFLPIILSTFMK